MTSRTLNAERQGVMDPLRSAGTALDMRWVCAVLPPPPPPQVARVLNNMGICCTAAGRLEEALHLHERSLRLREQALVRGP